MIASRFAFKKRDGRMSYHLPALQWKDLKTVYAMSGEDGIIEKILANMLVESKTFVEIGINLNAEELAKGRRVLQGNCVLLEEQGWRGWWFDGEGIEGFPIHAEFITPMNINSILRKYQVPKNLGIFSLDVDGQDFWIFMALDYAPAIVIIEVNSHFDLDEHKTVEFSPRQFWKGDQYHGASIAALNDLATDKGYLLVYYNAANAFFVRRDLVANPHDFEFEKIAYRYDFHQPDQSGRLWVDVISGERTPKAPPASTDQ